LNVNTFQDLHPRPFISRIKKIRRDRLQERRDNMAIIKRFASEDYVEQNLQDLKYEVILTTPQDLTDE
jgi:hypothetical protein